MRAAGTVAVALALPGDRRDSRAADNRGVLARNGKLSIPVLAVWGMKSTSGSLVAEMMREVAENITGVCIPDTGHWIAEENPAAFTTELL